MTPIEKINLIHKIMFDVLDIKSQELGYKNWKYMKKEFDMEKWQVEFIEGSVRSALNKFTN